MYRGVFIPQDTSTGGSRRGEGPGKWVNYLTNGESITFRIVPPQDPLTPVPFTFVAHYIPTDFNGRKLNAYIPCTANDPQYNGECHICRLKAEGKLKADWGSGPKKRAGIIIDDLTEYHKLELPDGKVVYEKCHGVRCQHCASGVPKVTGGERYLSLPVTALIPISQIYRTEIFGLCKNCGNPMTLDAAVCPQCGNVLMSAKSLNLMSDDAFGAYMTNYTKCPNCGKMVLPELAMKCRACGGTESVEIYDVVWTIKRLGEKQNTTYNITYEIDPLEAPPEPKCYRDVFTITPERQLKILGG